MSDSHNTLSQRQLREVRKELLIARAAVERMAIREAQVTLARRMSRFGWLGMLLPGFAHRADAGSGDKILSAVPEFLRPGLQALIPLLRRHPVFSALLSMLIGVPGTNGGERGQKSGGPAKWVGAAVLGFKVLGFWRRMRSGRAARKARR